jgi:hypothetical protein
LLNSCAASDCRDEIRARWKVLVKKERVIDHHQKDQCKEVVTDPETGEVIHHCEGPLYKHTSHGSAKRK